MRSSRLAALWLAAVFVVGCPFQKWERYQSDRDGFIVYFPGTPRQDTLVDELEGGGTLSTNIHYIEKSFLKRIS